MILWMFFLTWPAVCDGFFFRYSVEDLSTEQKYLVNLNIQICLEANKPCVVDVPVFKNTKLPKKPCQWMTGFLNEGKGTADY